MATRGMQRVLSDMDDHGKLKTEVKAVIKEIMDANPGKDDKTISALIKRRCDTLFGYSWHCVIGEDFKAAITHDNKHFIFVTMGKTNVLLYKCG